jgi:hypothetical protein
VDDSQWQATFQKQQQWALNSIGRGFRNAINQAHLRCVNEYKPFEASKILDLYRQASLLGVYVGDQTEIMDRVRRCFRFEFQFESLVDADYPTGVAPEDMTDAAVHVALHTRTEKGVMELDDTLMQFVPKMTTMSMVDWKITVWGSRARMASQKGFIAPVYMKIITEPPPENPNPPKNDPCAVPPEPDEPKPIAISFLAAGIGPGRAQVFAGKPPAWHGQDAFTWEELFGQLYPSTPFPDENGNPGQIYAFNDDWSFSNGRLFARMVSEKGPKAIVPNDGDTAYATTTIELWHSPLPPQK